MFSVRRPLHDALPLAVLAGLILIWSSPAPGRAEAPVRALIQQGSIVRAMEHLPGEVSGAGEKVRLFQKAYCLQRLERWPAAAELYQRLLSFDDAAGKRDLSDPAAEGAPSAGEPASAGQSPDSVRLHSDEADVILRDYLLLFAATCLFQIEDWTAAERHLDALLGRPESLLRAEAEELLGRLYLRCGRPEKAIPLYRRLSAGLSGRTGQTRFLHGLAAAYRQAGQETEAAAELKEIIIRHPSSREALPALEDYERLRDMPLEGEMLYRAGWVYFRGRRYDRAAEVWDRFAESSPRHELVDRTIFLGARAHFQAGRYASARERCRRLLSDDLRSEWQTSCDFLLARCDEEERLIEKAIEGYRRFVEAYPWSQLADDALWRLARIAERDGRLADAEREYRDLSRRYASRPDALLALWRAGLLALHRGDAGTARRRLRRLLNSRSGQEYIDGARYWIARTHAAEGDHDLAGRRMAEILKRSGDGYYGDRAACWLGRSSPPGMDSHERLADLLAGMAAASSADLPDDLRLRLLKGRELVRLGLLSRARQELRAVHQAAHGYPAAVGELLRLYQSYQLPGDALRLAVSLRSHWLQPRVRQALQRYLYPLGYAQLVESEAETAGLDPYLIQALMRTESLFDPLAESPAGARGLLQIMPATGQEIAVRLGAPDGEETNPFEPRWSIRMGVYYLAEQLRAHGGQLTYALAAYNAGPGNTDRWLKRLDGIDPELFVELIDFRETRRFIKKVLTARARYRKVWGDDG